MAAKAAWGTGAAAMGWKAWGGTPSLASIVPPSGLTDGCCAPEADCGALGTCAALGGAGAAAGAGGAGSKGGGGAIAPGGGGATPSIVPLSRGRGAAETAPPIGATAPGPGVGATRGTLGGAFTMSMVPLNFGAAAPLRLNPHFLQLVAWASFSVPQFGQNTLT
jgi:hypothetical protein